MCWFDVEKEDGNLGAEVGFMYVRTTQVISQ